MKVIEEKHNHINKVYLTVCHSCGSTLEYDDNDITYGLRQDSYVILCPVCKATIPHLITLNLLKQKRNKTLQRQTN